MNRSLRLLLVASAISGSLAGCASRPKAPVGATPAEPAMSQPSTDLSASPAPDAGAGFRGGQADLAVTAGERVFFAFDSHALDGEARETLRRQADWLAAHPAVRVRIAGNADERGTREYNLALGARRAAAAREALIGSGVASTRLETISYGKEQPFDFGAGENAWARNRNARSVVIEVASP